MDVTLDHETGIKYKVWVEVERVDYDNGTLPVEAMLLIPQVAA